nr:unnamed protein product [Callosobruchus analis]
MFDSKISGSTYKATMSGEYFVIKLTENIHGSNRNITMDNWFTSVNLADILVKPPYRLTVLGTLRQNKREIPPEMLHLKGREVGSSRILL